MRLILIRHGETAWNEQGKFQGQSPIDLNDKGLSQANRLAKVIAAMAPDSIYSSPLARTLSTARIIAEPLSKPVSTLEGLKEISLGELEGITGQEMRERYPELHEAWNAHAPSVTFPRGGVNRWNGFRTGPGLAWSIWKTLIKAKLSPPLPTILPFAPYCAGYWHFLWLNLPSSGLIWRPSPFCRPVRTHAR